MNTNKRSLSRKQIRDQERKSIQESRGWHPADIKAALEKIGLSLAELSRRTGYHPTAAGRALRTSWPEMERVIAKALGTTPQAIWPDRYTPEGIPLKYLPRHRCERGV